MPIKVCPLETYGTIIIVSDKNGDCIGIIRSYDTKSSSLYVFNYDVQSWKGIERNDLQIVHNKKNDTSRYEDIKISISKQNSVYFTLTVPICCSCNDVAVKKCDDCIVESTFSFYCKNCFDDKHKKDIASSHKCIDII